MFDQPDFEAPVVVGVFHPEVEHMTRPLAPGTDEIPDLYLYAALMHPTTRYPNGVVDGDTVAIDISLGLGLWTHNVRLRLYGISAPEVRGMQRPRGVESKEALERLIAHMLPDGELLVRTYKDKSDSFGRWLGEIWTPSGQSCLNALMVKHGFATWQVDW